MFAKYVRYYQIIKVYFYELMLGYCRKMLLLL